MTEATTRFLEDSDARLAFARSLDPGAEIELYRRSSVRRRVSLECSGAEPRRVVEGIESGIALRRIDPARGTAGFAAGTDAGTDSVRLLLRAAREDARPQSGEAWTLAESGRPAPDEDPGSDEPAGSKEMEAVLRDSVDRLRSGVPAGLGLDATEAWIETAVTRDALTNTRGTSMARVRTRTWMFLRVRWSAAGESHESPRLLAVRGAGRLPVAESVLRHAAARLHACRDRPEAPSGLVQLTPESAAVLVSALAGTLHGPSGRLGGPVAGGYRIVDDPGASGGLFGGRFDDAGWTTRRLRVADGERVVGRIDGRGHLWRASYRDRPSPRASNLVLEAGPEDRSRPPTPIWVDLRVHGLDPDRWVLEALVTGPDGEPGPGMRGRVRLEVDPRELPSRTIGTTGEPALSANGVTAPAVLLDL